jgi:Spy/CpxP family protein refolding chaperone
MQKMTPEQHEAMRSQMQERRVGARNVPEALRPVMEQVRANQRAAMQEAYAVLTPEQQARMRELTQQRRGQMGERMNRRPAGR